MVEIKKYKVHQLVVSTIIYEKELFGLIANQVAEKSEIVLDPKDDVSVFLTKEDKGSGGYQYQARVVIKQDIIGGNE